MRIGIFFLFYSSLYIPAISQEYKAGNNSANYISRLDIFKDESEKKVLMGFSNGSNSDYLELYLQATGSIDGIDDIGERINSFIQKSGFSSKQYNSKDLKKLYKAVHSEFLSKYIDNPRFNEIFVSGNYNCVTASALYSLILEKLSIQYDIRETPNHVYIVADPASANIMFETTAPGAKIIQITEKFKTQFVDYLFANKLLTAQDEGKSDKNELFEKYFYNDQKIDQKELGGLMYYNLGVDALSKENYSDAHKNFEKSYLLYPSPKTKFLLLITLLNKLYQPGMQKNEYAWAYYLRYLELGNNEIGKELVESYANDLIQNMLFKTPQPVKFHSIYKEILSNVTDTVLSKTLRYNYYYNTAHYFDIKNKYDSALIYVDSLYVLNKYDLLVHELITNLILEQLRLFSPGDPATIDTMRYFFNRYTFIDKKTKLGEAYLYCLAAAISKQYSGDNKKEGDKYLLEITDVINEQPAIVKKNEDYIAACLVEIYVYYVRHKEYKEAKKFLQTAEKLLPGNKEIALRMERINDILENM